MGRRRTRWCYETMLRYQQNGRGQGDLGEYRPWITIHDFPSKGKVVRVMGQKTKRIHHLLSQLEKYFFLILDSDPEVEDIKEQYPLPLEQTQLIACRLQIQHPIINGFPYVMTTDFLYKKSGTWHAVQIKPSSYRDNSRILEKFKIEKEFYDSIGVEWRVLTEKDLPKDMADNYFWLNSGETIDNLIPSSHRRHILREAFLELYRDNSVPFHVIVREMDEQCGLIPGTTIQLFKHLIKNNEIQVDIGRHISTFEPRASCQTR